MSRKLRYFAHMPRAFCSPETRVALRLRQTSTCSWRPLDAPFLLSLSCPARRSRAHRLPRSYTRSCQWHIGGRGGLPPQPSAPSFSGNRHWMTRKRCWDFHAITHVVVIRWYRLEKKTCDCKNMIFRLTSYHLDLELEFSHLPESFCSQWFYPTLSTIDFHSVVGIYCIDDFEINWRTV